MRRNTGDGNKRMNKERISKHRRDITTRNKTRKDKKGEGCRIKKKLWI